MNTLEVIDYRPWRMVPVHATLTGNPPLAGRRRRSGRLVIYCINLRRRRDRWRRMQYRFRRLGLDARRFDAIDGSLLDIGSVPTEIVRTTWDTTQNAKWDRLVPPGKVCQLSPGEIGCILSHVRVWGELLDLELPYMLVLEDDVDLHPDVLRVARRAIRDAPRWDLIYLGHEGGRFRPAPGRSGIAVPTFLFGTYGYLISRRGASRLLTALPVDQPLDNFLSSRFCALSVFCVTEKVVYHQVAGRSGSDIMHSSRQLLGAFHP